MLFLGVFARWGWGSVLPPTLLFMIQKDNDESIERCNDQVCPSDVIQVVVTEKRDCGTWLIDTGAEKVWTQKLFNEKA